MQQSHIRRPHQGVIRQAPLPAITLVINLISPVLTQPHTTKSMLISNCYCKEPLLVAHHMHAACKTPWNTSFECMAHSHLGVAEHLADEARGLADVLVHDGGGDDLEEVGVDVARDRARQQRLACQARSERSGVRML